MMRELYVIEGGPEPVTPGSVVRKRVREKRPRNLPQCTRCGGRETIVATIGNVRSKLCVACMMKGERVVVS